jgi:hypothetical protein
VLLGPALAAAGGCAEDRSVGAPVVTAFDGTRMKPAELVYEWFSLVGETPTADPRRYTMRVERARLDGTDVWVQRLQIGATITPSRTLDSLYYDARTMTPTRSVSADRKGGRWVWERRDGLVRLTEAPPWVSTLDTAKTGKRNFRRMVEREMREPMPARRSPGATVGPAPLELLAPGLPLASDWRGTLNVLFEPLNLAYGSANAGAMEAHALAVTGTRTVTTPAGTFEAWVLRGTAPASKRGEKPYALEVWIDRKDGWLLRQQVTRLDDDGDPWIAGSELERVTPLR